MTNPKMETANEYFMVFAMEPVDQEEREKIQEAGVDTPTLGMAVKILAHNLEDEGFATWICKKLDDENIGAHVKYTAQGEKLHTSSMSCCNECQRVVVERMKKHIAKLTGDNVQSKTQAVTDGDVVTMYKPATNLEKPDHPERN